MSAAATSAQLPCGTATPLAAHHCRCPRPRLLRSRGIVAPFLLRSGVAAGIPRGAADRAGAGLRSGSWTRVLSIRLSPRETLSPDNEPGSAMHALTGGAEKGGMAPSRRPPRRRGTSGVMIGSQCTSGLPLAMWERAPVVSSCGGDRGCSANAARRQARRLPDPEVGRTVRGMPRIGCPMPGVAVRRDGAGRARGGPTGGC